MIKLIKIKVFRWENFDPGYQDLGRKNRDLGNRASPASHKYIEIFTKERVAKLEGLDLGNRARASPVEPAHMKRP